MEWNTDANRGPNRSTAYARADVGSGVATVPRGQHAVEDDPERATVCVVGLGYVGLPLTVAFDAAGRTVIGYDVDHEKIDRLRAGSDPIDEVGDRSIEEADARYTARPGAIGNADFVVITVPTPVDDAGNPDLAFVESAGRSVGEHLTPGTTVILESTVFPGATEEVLAPAIEEESGYAAGEEFFLGYSPERASPGDAGRGVEDVVKIVGANDDEVRESIATLYESIVDAGVYRAPDIRTAEAAKVVENVQRDVNIALVNELAIACDHMDLSTDEVLDAAGTKWNFHDEYSPGLVGGHCIPVDPHYLVHRSEQEGFTPKLALQARETNERVPTHTAELAIKALNESGKVLKDSEVLVLGLAYKPNVGDIRTSEVDGVVSTLREYGLDVAGFDPHADDDVARDTFDLDVRPELDPDGADALLVATPHDEFEGLDLPGLAASMADDPVLVDVRGAFDEDAATDAGFTYRRL